MPTIALHSDLHIELQSLTNDWLRAVPDVLILAGDIGYISKVESKLRGLADQYSDMHVIYVTGNHEYYGADVLRCDRKLSEALKDHLRIHFLQCESVELFGIRFLGCTGWSQMLTLGKDKQSEVMATAGYSINDFNRISVGYRAFTPSDCVAMGESHYTWLESELSATCDLKTFVITHFSPSLEVRNTRYPVDNLTAYFCSSYDELINQYSPVAWAFGHTHFNHDTYIGSTRVVSNQKGYGKECIETYDSNMLIEL